MSNKTRFYVFIVTFASLFPIYILLMALSGENNLFLRFARLQSGFLAVLGMLIVIAFAICMILDLFFVLKGMLIKPKLGEILVSQGYIEKEELEGALLQQSLKFGEILVNEGHITKDQLNKALEIQKEVPKKIGDILKEMGLITDKEINLVLAKMKRRLGRVLLDMGLLSEYDIGWALSRQRKPARLKKSA